MNSDADSQTNFSANGTHRCGHWTFADLQSRDPHLRAPSSPCRRPNPSSATRKRCDQDLANPSLAWVNPSRTRSEVAAKFHSPPGPLFCNSALNKSFGCDFWRRPGGFATERSVDRHSAGNDSLAHACEHRSTWHVKWNELRAPQGGTSERTVFGICKFVTSISPLFICLFTEFALHASWTSGSSTIDLHGA